MLCSIPYFRTMCHAWILHCSFFTGRAKDEAALHVRMEAEAEALASSSGDEEELTLLWHNPEADEDATVRRR